MSVWSRNRKSRLEKPPQLDPVEDMTVRVAHRICAIVYTSCDCKRRGRSQACDVMKKAAQEAFAEIAGK